MIYIYIERLFD